MEKYCIANWKMQLPIASMEKYMQILGDTVWMPDVHVVLAVPATHIIRAKQSTGKNIMIAAQNIHEEALGAYTGEISGELAQDAGAGAVIIGHSERRAHLHETNSLMAKKILQAVKNNLFPILCVGETMEQREQGTMSQVVREQIRTALSLVSKKIQKLIVAYEPVWAIGTGRAANPRDIEEMHVFIRRCLVETIGEKKAKNIPLAYGGSITPKIAKELGHNPNVNGFLVGKASLDPKSFLRIVQALSEKPGF